MDTKTFLSTILPSSGVKYVMRLVPRPGNPKGDASVHYIAPDAETAAELIVDLDRKHPDHNIYYAMASYKEAKYKTKNVEDKRNGGTKEFTYVVGRTQDNALDVKCLWQDWDVGKDNPNSYASREEAMQAIKEYLRATGLPVPLIVSSGYGIHTYWLFTESVPAEEWESIAANQRVIMRHLGVKFDPSRDKDCASVLRPVGTRNKKAGKEPKYVKVIKDEINRLPAQEYKRLLRKYVEENKLESQVVEAKPSKPDWLLNSSEGNLSAVAFPSAYASIIVQHCNQVREFSNTGGEQEPIWHANLGLLKHCADGEKLAHEWSSKHPEYNHENTQSKFDRWEFGPTTCAKFAEINPKACDGCKHKCKSPISLGQDDRVELPNIAAIAAEAAIEAAESKQPKAVCEAVTAKRVAEEDADTAGVPLGWPSNFDFDPKQGVITKKVQDENGVWHRVRVAEPLFYPVGQVEAEDGTSSLQFHIWIRKRVREFSVPMSHLEDHRRLMMDLASHRVHVINRDAVLELVKAHSAVLTREREEVQTYKQFGWQHDFKGFLIGNTLITEDESRTVALADKVVRKLRQGYAPKGDYKKWVAAVDTLFNRENGEPYQFAICAAFSSVLNPLLGYSEWVGIPYALTSNHSGYGKSTVNKIALSIWWHQNRDTVVADSTPKAILGRASLMNNVPFLLDEVTGYLKNPADQVDVLYALSNGAPRNGMTAGGAERDSMPGWNGTYAMTGNRNILQQVTENKLNPEAVQMRVFEIDLENYPRLTTMDEQHPDYARYNAEHALLARTIVDECYGEIGPEFIRFVMRNREEVQQRLRRVSVKMSEFMEGGDSTKERFYYHLITCVLVAGYYAKKLGFINFDLNNLRDWCINHVRKLRSIIAEMKFSPEDNFANLMADLSGRIVVTRNFSLLDKRAKKTEIHIGGPLRNPIAGRYVIGTENERPQLYITTKAIMDWCAEQGIQYSVLRRDFMSKGLIRLGVKGVNRETGAVRVSISRGVDNIPSLGEPWCLELDAERAAGLIPKNDPAEVTPLITEAA